jgi:hypothetical protein
MGPTVFREGAYRFFFFSREEFRPHIHINHPTGEAKFWLDPRIELAVNQPGLFTNPCCKAQLSAVCGVARHGRSGAPAKRVGGVQPRLRRGRAVLLASHAGHPPKAGRALSRRGT